MTVRERLSVEANRVARKRVKDFKSYDALHDWTDRVLERVQDLVSRTTDQGDEFLAEAVCNQLRVLVVEGQDALP